MSGPLLPEQQAFTYEEEKRIPRRRSATNEELLERRRAAQGQPTHTSNVPARRPGQSADVEKEDDEILDEGYNPYRTPNSSRRYAAMPVPGQRIYEIPLTDGTVIRVTSRELSTMPQEYKDAAQQVASVPALPLPKPTKSGRPRDPRRPPQDASVIRVAPPHAKDTEDVPDRRRWRLPRFHGMVWLGIAMTIMIFGWLAISALGSWWQNVENYWQYGMPRTYQTDANVGHGTASDPNSHFIAENLNKHIIVIEIPGGDPSKSRIYVGPILLGPGQELAPVTLSFTDVNGDGKKDMIIQVEGSRFIFLNDGKEFKPAPNQ